MDPPTYPFEETSFMDGPLKKGQNCVHVVIEWPPYPIFGASMQFGFASTK